MQRILPILQRILPDLQFIVQNLQCILSEMQFMKTEFSGHGVIVIVDRLRQGDQILTGRPVIVFCDVVISDSPHWHRPYN